MNKQTRHLLLFSVATFVWTWAFYAPMAIGGHNPYQMPWTILLICGGMGPSLVGVALVLLTFEKERRREFWRRSFSVRRICLSWWAVMLVAFPLLFAASIALDLVLGGTAPGMSEFKSLLADPATVPLTVLISFLSGPWSEEFGWRGYALDPLLERLGIVRVGAGVGRLAPPALLHGGHVSRADGVRPQRVVELPHLQHRPRAADHLGVYLHTKRSILAAMLLHFTANFTSQLVAPYSGRVEVILSLLALAIGLAVCALAACRASPMEPRAVAGRLPAELPEPTRR